ncbi:MAG: hypothetical protein AABY22_08320 [Nanoarchaeota archaeon]
MKKTKKFNPKTKESIPSDMISFETFSRIGDREIQDMKQNQPSCFNSTVRILKYKVTCELIEEPKEVYAERLNKIWK